MTKKYYDKLVSIIKEYYPEADLTDLDKAYEIACTAHSKQQRKSGEPYIIHPLNVAIILAELKMDLSTIIAGLLHDVIEDTEYDYDYIKDMFSPEIAELVAGVTKLDKIKYTSTEDLQAENYKKMFLAMTKDIRVIIIKIADRLHNMQTLRYMPDDKKARIAHETIEIYAPLAHRLGISTIKIQLEDLCFKYLNKNEYEDLSRQIKSKQTERLSFIKSIQAEIQAELDAANINATIEGRPKHFYSIYKKMINQNKTLDQIYDLFAIRILVDTNMDCYTALGIVHDIYTPVPGRFKDYISMPKQNNYQSIHTTVISHTGERFEVQIRTKEMHLIADYGIAAHWKYKEGTSTSLLTKEDEKLAWIRQFVDLQKDVTDNSEYLGALKGDLDFYEDQVYCFTPKGEVIALNKGATPIDFAYAIHTDIGNQMVGCNVNGKLVHNDYTLATGDFVQIRTRKDSKGPSLDWLKIVKTSQAKNKIRTWFKSQNKEENILAGKESLEREAKKRHVDINDILTPKAMEVVLEKFAFKDWDSMYAAIGHGGIKDTYVFNRLYEVYEKENSESKKQITVEEVQEKIKNEMPKNIKNPSSGIILPGVGFTPAKFSRCCCPIPGDDIVAFSTRGRGCTVHKSDCINILNMPEEDKKRLLAAQWPFLNDETVKSSFSAIIKVTGSDRTGLFSEISNVFTSEKVPITNLTAKVSGNIATFTIEIKIHSAEEINHLFKKIDAIKGITSFERVTV